MIWLRITEGELSELGKDEEGPTQNKEITWEMFLVVPARNDGTELR